MNYAYAERPEPEPWVSEETYTDQPEALPTMTTYEWNHGLGEIVIAVLDAGLVLTGLFEHYSARGKPFPGR